MFFDVKKTGEIKKIILLINQVARAFSEVFGFLFFLALRLILKNRTSAKFVVQIMLFLMKKKLTF